MYHKIDCYAIHTSTTRKKQGFKKIILFGVLHDQTSGVSLIF